MSRLVVRAIFDRPSGSYVELAERLSRMASIFDDATSTHAWRVPMRGPWEGDMQARAALVQADAESLERGRVELWHGVVTSIGCRDRQLHIELRICDGATFTSVRMPQLSCSFTLHMLDGSPLSESFVSAAVEALVVGLVPMQVVVNTGEMNELADRWEWDIPAGYQLWLRDDIAQFDALPEGVSGERLENGTLLKVDPTWDDERVVAAMAEVRERYKLDQLPH